MLSNDRPQVISAESLQELMRAAHAAEEERRVHPEKGEFTVASYAEVNGISLHASRVEIIRLMRSATIESVRENGFDIRGKKVGVYRFPPVI